MASCFLPAPPHDLDADPLTTRWSMRSGIAADEMTVNIVPIRQGGKPYAAMAWLYLPTTWSQDEVASLTHGLATALAEALPRSQDGVHVIVSIIPAGHVVAIAAGPT